MKTKLSLLAFLIFPSFASATYYSDKNICSEITHTFTSPSFYHYTNTNGLIAGQVYVWNGSQCQLAYRTIRSSVDGDDYYAYGQPLSYTCPNGTSRNSSTGQCTPPCSVGSSFDPFSQTCVAPSFAQYNNDYTKCHDAGGAVGNIGFDFFSLPGLKFDCVPPNPSFMNNTLPTDCDTKGGYVMYGSTGYQCGTLGDVFGEVFLNVLSVLPALNALKNPFMKSALKSGTIDALKNLLPPSSPSKSPNIHIDLPKLPSPDRVMSGSSDSTLKNVKMAFDNGITTSPPSDLDSGGHVVSQPSINVSPLIDSIPDFFILPVVDPVTSSSIPRVDYSTVDGFNIAADISTSPLLSDIVPPVGSTSKPVKETFDFSKIMPDVSSPSTIAMVPVTTTKTQTYSGSDSVDNYVTTTNYPDGTSSTQTIKINTYTKQGSWTITTLSPSGDTNTIYEAIYVPAYTGSLNGGVTIQSPSGTTFSPPTTTTPPINTTIPTTTPPTTTNPDNISGQNPADLLNAKMPSYSLPELENYVPYDSSAFNDMKTGVSELLTNIGTQLTAVKTSFDTTKALLNGSWSPPVIPAGACGDSLVLHWHGRNVDLCPPMMNATSQVSPIVTPIITLGGMALAITIFIGGF